jgi:hypothetical protein
MVWIAGWAVAVGCDRGATTTAPPPPATQHVAATQAAPATQPSVALIWLEQQAYLFPPAKIVQRTKDDQLIALLFSDDPPNAIEDSYTGNSFYLELTELETPQPGKLSGATWHYKASDSERAESVNGIFLRGRQSHLQPFDVQIQFDGEDPPLTVRLAGRFLQFDTSDAQTPGKLVMVRAELLADVKIRGQK